MPHEENRRPPTAPERSGHLVQDATGRAVTVIDPVTMFVTNQTGSFDRDILRSIAESIAPQQRLRLMAAIATGVALALVMAGGQLAYHRFKGGWPTADVPSVIIWTMQLALCFTMVFIVWRQGRANMRLHAFRVLLKNRHCPHCGYNLTGLSVETDTQATCCPECACRWRLDEYRPIVSSDHLDNDMRRTSPGRIIAILVGSIVLLVALFAAVILWLT